MSHLRILSGSDHSWSTAIRDNSTTKPVVETQPPPALRRTNPNTGRPLDAIRVFAFPLGEEHLVAWADSHGLASGHPEYIRSQIAFRKIMDLRPQKDRKAWIGCIYHKEPDKISSAIILASNRSEKELALAENIELVQQYYDLLGTQPGWFRFYRC